MKKRYVTPSILNVDENKRIEMVNNLLKEGIEWIHYDVMDGVFVPNTAIKYSEIEKINQDCPKHFKDVHLMVSNPLEIASEYKNLADIITIHYEAVSKTKLLKFLRENKHDLNIGLAIKPSTLVSEIEDLLPLLRLVLVMSVEPGAGGQKFIQSSLDKIKLLKNLRLKKELNFLIQVDGGINNITGPQSFKAGADACVVGTFLIKNPTKETINSILKK
ncbi:ribulose-phosphate 3-epimerase [Mycoplasmopsis columbina]|uniref:ribulose-phosphate 3-epimerase n=1 Tax=Mycoplasmopsis columbina TaxID=114881 RepID=UPI0004A73F42|nr:ribulose-phosphate 3-epimerase [Mycoplasmopsis columbina]VEU77141.1 d-ribulose-5-phosphate 3 epimerase [Mycoplasmopsis columbina]